MLGDATRSPLVQSVGRIEQQWRVSYMLAGGATVAGTG